jgi:hypothetical protein
MSITFYCDGVPFEDWEPYPEEPGYKERRPVAPFFELNMANGNAMDFLGMLCPKKTYDYCGHWTEDELPAILARATLLRYSDEGMLLLEPVMEYGGVNSCRVVECGRDKAYVHQRLEQFMKLIALAIAHGKTVSFA